MSITELTELHDKIAQEIDDVVGFYKEKGGSFKETVLGLLEAKDIIFDAFELAKLNI